MPQLYPRVERVLKKLLLRLLRNDGLIHQVYASPSAYMKIRGAGWASVGLLPCSPMNVPPGLTSISILRRQKSIFNYPKSKGGMQGGDGCRAANGRSIAVRLEKGRKGLVTVIVGYITTIA
jgi:hypothetical protein